MSLRAPPDGPLVRTELPGPRSREVLERMRAIVYPGSSDDMPFVLARKYDHRLELFGETGVGRSEFAGCQFSASGEWLFVNIQYLGTTYAITGPWEQGSL